VYGRLHAQQAQPEQARARLEAALAIFQRLGAQKDSEHVEQAIASFVGGIAAAPAQ
jgi:hypothetical protein